MLFLLKPTASDGSSDALSLPPNRGDGSPSDEDIPATYAANRVVGDIYPQGADDPFQRLTDTVVGAGLFTTNSDPNVVGVDPLTGEDAPAGTDVGFGSALRRYFQTNILNGDFTVPPPDIEAAIDDSNPLPYWTWTQDANGEPTLFLVADTDFASGYKLQWGSFTLSTANLSQWVPVPMSQGQQYRVLLSMYADLISPFTFRYQFYKPDATTAIGSEVSTSIPGAGEVKVDAGLVPPTAGYVKVRIVANGPGVTGGGVGEVRCAFLPAEATLGLGSITAASAGITTTQTQVKGITIPAGSFTVGSVYRITAWGVVASSAANVVTFRVRCGPTTLTGNIVTSMNPTATTTATTSDAFKLEAMVTVRSVGASGSMIGGISMVAKETQPFAVGHRTEQSLTAGAIAVDTTVANILELTCVTAAGTTTVTFQQCVIECVMAS